jgi:hypothetical protein
MIAVTHNLADLNRALARYIALSGKLPGEAIAKQGGKFAYTLSRRLRGLAPRKGSIRAERLSALARGEGVRIRPRIREALMRRLGAHSDVRTRQTRFMRGKKSVATIRRGGKRLNLQALMVQRELNTREAGRGFLSVSARYPRELKISGAAESRFGPVLSKAGVSLSADAHARFTWNPSQSELSGQAGAGLSRPKARAIIALSLRDVTRDIRAYIERKVKEAL